MNSNTEIYDFLLDNIQKIMVPEEIIAIGMSITRLELLALLLIKRNQAMSMGNLAHSMAAPMSTVTGIADRLVKKELLQRGNSVEDRRIVTISLTGRGQDFVNGVQEHFHDILGRIRKVITEEEFQLAINLLQKVTLGLQKDNPVTPGQSVRQRRNIKIE